MSRPSVELHARLHGMKRGEQLTARLCHTPHFASPWCTYLPLISLSTAVVCALRALCMSIAHMGDLVNRAKGQFLVLSP